MRTATANKKYLTDSKPVMDSVGKDYEDKKAKRKRK
jgi:hypothetical protein